MNESTTHLPIKIDGVIIDGPPFPLKWEQQMCCRLGRLRGYVEFWMQPTGLMGEHWLYGITCATGKPDLLPDYLSEDRVGLMARTLKDKGYTLRFVQSRSVGQGLEQPFFQWFDPEGETVTDPVMDTRVCTVLTYATFLEELHG